MYRYIYVYTTPKRRLFAAPATVALGQTFSMYIYIYIYD